MSYARGRGRYHQQYRALWERLVPSSGQANTVQGELVRAIGRLASECYRNGNGNWDAGFRMFVNLLRKHLADPKVFDSETVAQIKQDLRDIGDIGNGTKDFDYPDSEDVYDRVTDRVVEWCQEHPDPIPRAKNPRLKR